VTPRALAASAVALAAVLFLVGWRFAASGGAAGDIPVAVVAKGNLRLTLEEVGELRAKRSVIIAAPNDKIITYLAPEGSVVQEGDLLLQLESSKYQMGVDEGQSAVEVAQAQLDKAKADLQAQLYKEEAAKKQYESLLELQQKGFAMTSEVEEARLGYLELQSKTGAFRAAVEQERAQVAKAGKSLDQVKHRLASNAVVSPMEGIVVYAAVGEPEEGKKVEVGFMPYEGQPLMELPDITTMQVMTEVNEMDVEKVQVGQAVEIRLDAVPDVVFPGKVARLGSLAQRKLSLSSGKRTAEKVFALEVDVEAADPRLRPGLSAAVSILVEELDEVVYVPVEAVFQEQGRSIAYVKKGRRAQAVALECGSSNDRYVVVRSGLQPGDRVLLAPPL
jgi:RND family efflux transporter MFP subunit